MENPMDEPMSRLTHDLIAEILSRLPYKSLCICKCFCPAWRGIIADPAYRKKMAQTLAGFFYRITDEGEAEPGGFSGVEYADLSAFPWSSVPDTRPRLPLPPDSTDCFFSLEDSCDGLFLASIRTGTPVAVGTSRYMVSNPATKDWSPPDHRGIQFQVVTQVRIYSSKTGAWVAMEPKWDIQVSLCFGQPRFFRNGCLHLIGLNCFDADVSGLAIVDAQGLKWRTVPLPADSFSGFIGKSHGHLFYIDSDTSLTTISVYTLTGDIYNWDVCHQDDDCIYWKLYKCSNVIPNKESLEVIGVHPHANLIFIAHSNNQVLAYDLDRQESTVVCHLGHTYHTFMQFFPYVPLLSCLPLDGGIRLVTPS
ncbi:hypothetical protein ACQJBY_070083 [Aegilops geniculata]